MVNHILLYNYAIVCLPIHLLMPIWGVSRFNYQIKKIAMSVHSQVFVWTYAFIPHG